jgi:hypothetical protein
LKRRNSLGKRKGRDVLFTLLPFIQTVVLKWDILACSVKGPFIRYRSFAEHKPFKLVTEIVDPVEAADASEPLPEETRLPDVVKMENDMTGTTDIIAEVDGELLEEQRHDTVVIVTEPVPVLPPDQPVGSLRSDVDTRSEQDKPSVETGADSLPEGSTDAIHMEQEGATELAVRNEISFIHFPQFPLSSWSSVEPCRCKPFDFTLTRC